eukprot:TRINITY_DN6320_c0_g1_i2.p1 TRINITY_DN6320_c0_g1~~TRINITY_DN6320_c0_g1_i2.p1  ORF type:complete len:354 (+),score=103.16 TRINITY_DN6320_c0_g1_i2:40-1101(+)
MDSQLAVVLVTNLAWMSIAVVVYLNGKKNDNKNKTKETPARSTTPEPVTPVEVKEEPTTTKKEKKGKKDASGATGVRKRSVSFTKEHVCLPPLLNSSSISPPLGKQQTILFKNNTQDIEKELLDWQSRFDRMYAENERVAGELEALKNSNIKARKNLEIEKKEISEEIKAKAETIAALKKESVSLRTENEMIKNKLKEEAADNQKERDLLLKEAEDLQQEYKIVSKQVASVEKLEKGAKRNAERVEGLQKEAGEQLARIGAELEESEEELRLKETENAALKEQLAALIPADMDVETYLKQCSPKHRKGGAKGRGGKGSFKGRGGKGTRGGKSGKAGKSGKENGTKNGDSKDED